MENVLAALPQVQAAVRTEIAARIATGEEIASASTMPRKRRTAAKRAPGRKSAA